MKSNETDKLEKIKEIMNNDNFSRHCNMKILEVSEGYAKARMDIKKDHLNFFETVHGGAIFSLADMTLGAASNSYGTLAMAINCSIHYLKAAREGSLTAIANETSINPRIASYTINIYDDENDVVANFQGMVYRKKQNVI